MPMHIYPDSFLVLNSFVFFFVPFIHFSYLLQFPLLIPSAQTNHLFYFLVFCYVLILSPCYFACKNIFLSPLCCPFGSWALVGPMVWPCSSWTSMGQLSPQGADVYLLVSCCLWSSQLPSCSAESDVTTELDKRVWVWVSKTLFFYTSCDGVSGVIQARSFLF